MEMQRDTTEKLSRYFLNADPFLWGVLEAKNKKSRIKELQGMGLLKAYTPGSNPIYTKINRDLLLELGIVGILEKIVIPRVQQGFTSEVLRYFRDSWMAGEIPKLNFITQNKLYHKTTPITLRSGEVRDDWSIDAPVVGYRDPAFIFLKIERQFNVIVGWTVFAGLWFEEIEPILR